MQRRKSPKATELRADIDSLAEAGHQLSRMRAERDQALADLDEARRFGERAAARRDTYKTLSAIGVWHEDCRPNREMAARELQKSQAIIDKLADTITTLSAERDQARATICSNEDAGRQLFITSGTLGYIYDLNSAERDRALATLARVKECAETELRIPDHPGDRYEEGRSAQARVVLAILAQAAPKATVNWDHIA